MGFLNTPEYMQLIEATPGTRQLDYDEFDALFVARLVVEALGT
jgi:hypothetical protein